MRREEHRVSPKVFEAKLLSVSLVGRWRCEFVKLPSDDDSVRSKTKLSLVRVRRYGKVNIFL